MKFQGNGLDAAGTFTLNGSYDTSGTVYITKSYASSVPISITGTLKTTAPGIISGNSWQTPTEDMGSWSIDRVEEITSGAVNYRRRVGVLLCPECKFFDLPTCGSHNRLLTKAKGTEAQCSACDTATDTAMVWKSCRNCKKHKVKVSWMVISESEADYAVKCFPKKGNHFTGVILHCSTCCGSEFPGCNSVLVKYKEGKMYSEETSKYLEITDYSRYFSHSVGCTGTVSILPAMLSKDEIAWLNKTLKTSDGFV